MYPGFKTRGFGEVNGTSLVGYLYCTYEDLVRMFGEPKYGGPAAFGGGYADDGEKITTQWLLETPEGLVFTVYDWKGGWNRYAKTPYDWHVGGSNSNVINELQWAGFNVRGYGV
jgi:hypothetical protein